jgi:hypothetical protein
VLVWPWSRLGPGVDWATGPPPVNAATRAGVTVDGSTGGEDREVVLLGAILTPIHSAVALRPCV